MCSIFGAMGHVDEGKFKILERLAGDRGRDGCRVETYQRKDKEQTVWLGNCRATPTPEAEDAALQPYNGIVHNGTIANDKQLADEIGTPHPVVDSMILPGVLDRKTLWAFTRSLERIVGSYAIAAYSMDRDTIYLGCNYKPIHYVKLGGAVYFSSMERHLLPLCPWGISPVHMKPYSTMDLETGVGLEIERKDEKRALVIASGGLDSTVVATHYVHEGFHVELLHFDYGCRASEKEAKAVENIANSLGCDHTLLGSLRAFYPAFIQKNPLMDDTADLAKSEAGAEYAHEWVPARNLVMLSLAAAFAEMQNYHIIALGNNLEESGAYPDNEEQFTHLMNKAMDYAVQNGYSLRIESPVGHLMKHEIVKMGYDLEAPFEHTWSCYQGGEVHCGKCGPCFMRKTAFERNGLKDPVFVNVKS